MKILTNLVHKTSYSLLQVFPDFPDVPEQGMLVLKDDGILYIYSSIDGTPTWRPLNIKSKTYVHTQTPISTTWNITHSLDSKNLIYFIYDSNSIRQNEASIDFVDNNNITLSFTEAINGKAVIFAEGDNFSGVSGGTSSTSGTFTQTIISTSADTYSCSESEIVLCSGTIQNIILPIPVSGYRVDIKKLSESGSVNISTHSGETIDGDTAGRQILTQFESITFITDGLNWFII